MKIEMLEISGLRSHRGNPPTVIDLADKELVAVVGPTGAGKSSILEAVCFALFGEATFGGRVYTELASDGLADISARMVFTLGDARYQLVRVVARNRNGAYNSKELYLREIDEDDRAIRQVDQRRKVDKEISRLLGGLDRAQFCQAVLLAQNRYADLLEADETTRNVLLDMLLGLTQLDEARTATRKSLAAVQRNRERLGDQRAHLPADATAHAMALVTQVGRLDGLVTSTQEAADELSDLVRQSAELTSEAGNFDQAAQLRYGQDDGIARLARAADELRAAADAHAAIEVRDLTAREALDNARRQLDEARVALERAEGERGDSATHTTTITTLGHLRALLGELPDQEQSHINASAESDELESKVSAALTARDEAQARATQTTDALEATRGSAVDAHAALESRSHDLKSLDDQVGRARSATTPLSTAVDQIVATHAHMLATFDDLSAARDAHARAVTAVEDAQRRDAAAAAAHGCDPGDACPVCDRPLADDWSAPAGGELDAAQSTQRQASADLEAAQKANQRADSFYRRALADADHALDDIVNHVGALAALAQPCGLALPDLALPARPDETQTDRIAPATGADGDAAEWSTVAATAAALDAILERWQATFEPKLVPLHDAVRIADQAVEDTSGEDKAARGVADSARDHYSELEAKLAAATARRDGAEQAVSEALDRVARTAAALGDRWRALVDTNDLESIERAEALLADDIAAVGAAARVRQDADQGIRTAEQTLADLASERERTVDSPRRQAISALADLFGMTAELAELVGSARPHPINLDAAAGELAAAASLLRETAAGLVTQARSRSEDLRRQAADLDKPARSVLDALASAVADADPDGTAFVMPDSMALSADLLAAIQRLDGAAQARLDTTMVEARKAEEDRLLAGALDERIIELDQWWQDLDVASDLLSKEQFPAWARRQRVAELVIVASELLAEMTGGRYRFDEQFAIIDEATGASRKARTLSGGEKFEAALALALAVSEIAGRSGVRFDTLFLDEGFAGLDQNNLNRALDAIEREVEAGRCIVVITHIGAVADRIRDVLLISPDGMGGSSARWLDDDERSELGADLDLTSV